MRLPCGLTLEHHTGKVLLFSTNEQGQVVLSRVSVPMVK